MKKNVLILILAIVMLCTSLPNTVVYAENATATKTASMVLVDGVSQSFDAYNIKGNNYFKLRDIAFILNGTMKQFEVTWNEAQNAISMTTGKSYTSMGGEMQVTTDSTAKSANTTSSKILINGKAHSFTAYNIEGNNYFKLRDLGSYIDFGVDWNESANRIEISSDKGYKLDNIDNIGVDKPTVTKGPEVIVKDEWTALKMTEAVGYGGYNINSFSLDNNSSKVDDTQMIVLGNDNLGVFHHIEMNNGTHQLKVIIYNKFFEVVETKSITLPYTSWGGLILGTDGCYYVAVGQDNEEELDTKVVFSIIKYDEDFKELGRCDISNCYTSVPFYGSNCSMAMKGNMLVLYTARGRYKAADGLHHQSNIAFSIDTTTMKYYTGAVNHVSHCFNQLVKFDNDNLIYVSHGDAYPRAIVMNMLYNFAPQEIQMNNDAPRNMLNLIEIEGTIGDNVTGTRLGGFEIGTYHNLVAGTSIPHGELTNGVSENIPKNVYISMTSKDGRTSKLKWLTQYKKDGTRGAMNLRLVKINDNKFAVIYQEYENDTRNLVIILLDSNGKVLNTKKWKGSFAGNIQPIVYQGEILWIATKPEYNPYFGQLQEESVNNFVRINLVSNN